MGDAPFQSPTSQIVLCDTNILIIYARKGGPYRRLEARIGLQDGRAQGIVSVISVGEAFAFARKRDWGLQRIETLAELIRTKLVPVDINRPEVLAAYADIDHIDHFSEKVVKPARPMGQNDMWIAATAHVLNCELVTTDKDFDHLHGQKLQRRWIDPRLLKSD